MSNVPPQSVLRLWLDYNPRTGIFTWKKEPRPARPLIAKEAGCLSHGYIFIGVRGYPQIGAHRLAWVYLYGAIPDGLEIDHRDGNSTNNAISNLRLATSSQQKMNRSVQSNNRSGLKGAFYHACHKGKKWRSQIKVGERLIFLGYFHTAEQAHRAYCEAAPRYHKEFARAA